MRFYVRTGEAAALIEDANVTKQEYHQEELDRTLPDVLWDGLED